MKKKNVVVLITAVILLSLIGVIYFVFSVQDSKSTLTLSEKTWIENNKNNVIDLGIVNDVAILNYSGDGVIFDFIESIEENTGLEFNKVSYTVDQKIEDDYSFKRVNTISKNDISVYTDNYVLVGKTNQKINNLNQLTKSTVGVLKDNMADAVSYLKSDDLLFKSFNKTEEMINHFLSEESEVDYIILPKLILLSNLNEKKGLFINYSITEMKDNYVISLGKEKTLNNIISKYYKKWNTENFQIEFASSFTDMYFNIHEVEEKSKVKFRSKRYIYGFVENAPYDLQINSRLVGINSSIIKKFSELTNVEISFQSYKNSEKMLKAFNENKIDFYFNRYSNKKFNVDVFDTISTFDEEIVVLNSVDNNITINSANSLKNFKVSVLSNTMVEKELKDNNVVVESYKNINSLLNSLNKSSIVVVDKKTYEFYKNSKFNNFNVNHTFPLVGNYNYIVRDISNNKVFSNFLNYYLSFINEDYYIQEGFNNAVENNSNTGIIKSIIITIVLLVLLLGLLLFSSKMKPNRPKKRKINMKKEDKLKYIDMLTSLKNRNYLNERIELWDSSEVYPQSIVIVDLNNIAYINDNYGHQEGDNVIKQAAGILINSQVPNSDIIRTNGNEFLIYLVKYDEKQVVSYIKKLNKEFKELAHGFGAAAGYSMITDGIKTIDDAVNEATLDMRNNKEELNN
ncbi:MAG: GGDEF domain-containing protein [Bacilli bacterium]